MILKINSNLFKIMVESIFKFSVLLLITGSLTCFSCEKTSDEMPKQGFIIDDSAAWSLSHLDYEFLPERQFAYSEDSSLVAFYFKPTKEYNHGILGDDIEAKGVALYHQQKDTVLEFNLDNQYVFEDLVPRVVDLDKDSIPEIICIRTNVNKGAGIVIYKIHDDAIIEYAWVSEIGTKYRWLNIAAITDMDGDKQIEIAWVQTPHIGGVLKVARIAEGKLTVLDQYSGVSNHAIGSRNLDLSILRKVDNIQTLYLPTQSRKSVLGFQFIDNELLVVDTLAIEVDFSMPLRIQF